MNYYIDVLKQYAVFSGRARRKEYWMFVLFNFIVSLVIAIIATVVKLPILSTIYALAVFLPSLGVSIRRLHDIGKSGVWILISCIPVIGAIWLLILLVKEGDSTTNDYGENPKLAG